MTSLLKVADGIYRIDIGRVKGATSGNFLRCCLVYLIVTDGKTAIIETSPASVSPLILEAIEELGYEPGRLSYIILTHIHLDHAGGVGTLAKQFPGIKVVVHQRGARHLIDPEKLIAGTRIAYGEEYEADYGPILPVAGKQIQAVEEGDIISLGKRQLRIIYTPGHAPHHMCIYDAKTRGLFSGDSLGVHNMGNNPIIIVDGFNLDLTLESIDRISALNPERIYASHGTADREVDEFIQSARNTTKNYGDIVLEAMKTGVNKRETAGRLRDYHKANNPDDKRSTLRRFKGIIPFYQAHFKRKGVI